MTISIAMATYNGSQFLQAQLDSFLAQTVLPTELVVCDDGSTDGTLEILQRFQAEAPFRVFVHGNERTLGSKKNFEKALSLCRGEIVLLSDQDDVWFPRKIEVLTSTLQQDKGIMVALNDKVIADENLIPTDATMLTNIRAFGSPDICFVAGCCAAFRREWLDFALPIPEDALAHDSWLVGMAHRLTVVRIAEEPLQYYRRHDTNLSQNAYSSRRRVNLLDRIWTELSTIWGRRQDDDLNYWQSFLRWHYAEQARIREKRAFLQELGLGSDAHRAALALDKRIGSIEFRLHILKLPKLKRPRQIGVLWRAGGYAGFSGWRSALKDLVR